MPEGRSRGEGPRGHPRRPAQRPLRAQQGAQLAYGQGDELLGRLVSHLLGHAHCSGLRTPDTRKVPLRVSEGSGRSCRIWGLVWACGKAPQKQGPMPPSTGLTATCDKTDGSAHKVSTIDPMKNYRKNLPPSDSTEPTPMPAQQNPSTITRNIAQTPSLTHRARAACAASGSSTMRLTAPLDSPSSLAMVNAPAPLRWRSSTCASVSPS